MGGKRFFEQGHALVQILFAQMRITPNKFMGMRAVAAQGLVFHRHGPDAARPKRGQKFLRKNNIGKSRHQV